MTAAFLAALLAQSPIPLEIRNHVPIEVCVPVLSIDPQPPVYTFWSRDWDKVLWLRSDCGGMPSLRTACRWWVECDDSDDPPRVYVEPASGLVVGEKTVTLRSGLARWAPSGSYYTRCELSWVACPVGDMDADCDVDADDVRKLATSEAWNRLEVFAYLQREYGLSR